MGKSNSYRIDIEGELDERQATKRIAGYLGERFGAGILIPGNNVAGDRTRIFSRDLNEKYTIKYSLKFQRNGDQTSVTIYRNKAKGAEQLTPIDLENITEML